MAKSIRKYLSDDEALEAWLETERELVESRGACFSNWGTRERHLAFVITCGDLSGEMHVTSDGSISMYVERGFEDEVLLSTSTAASDEHGFKIFYRQFRDTILGAPP